MISHRWYRRQGADASSSPQRDARERALRQGICNRYIPRLWSEKALANLVNSSKNVDLAPDGKRVVAIMPAEAPEAQQSQSHVIFLENFFDELRRKVPLNGK